MEESRLGPKEEELAELEKRYDDITKELVILEEQTHGR